ncbi:hypothetical protein COO60DRAFT_1645717 [Scenedesmus sp. NREL 46B-D3]|nr:hypothetical protein COO60DRAFT_1645717 [Scenedesmus sp. NREL 46B-D3]
MPLHGITLPNKIGKPVGVPRLPLMFVLATDMRLKRLKQYSHSPVTWFRNPHTHLILVSSADVHEYKSTLRAQLKRVTADIERDWGGPGIGSEWVILYVRPFELEPADKNAKRVFEKVCDDFASKRRERVVRMDIPLQAFTGPAAAAAASQRSMQGGGRPGSGVLAGGQQQGVGVWGAGATGLEELCIGLRDSIRAAFEARQAAYDAEVRRLLNERRDPKWSFTTLYLVKDSFALMLEGAGLWEDAFQEYVELETVYLDMLESAAAATAGPSAAAVTSAEAAAAAVRDAAEFGLTGSDAEDVASLLSSSWRAMRRLVLWKKSVQEFHFRQYLFAAQARVLLRLGRPVDVAERGLVFVQNFLAILASREAAGLIKPWFKECWTFSACMSLITAVTGFAAQRTSLPPDWDASDLVSSSSGGPHGPAAQAAMRRLAAALAAEKAAAAAAAAAAAGSLGLESRAAASSKRSTEGDRSRARSISTSSSPAAFSSPAGAAPSSASNAASACPAMPILSGSQWELDASSTAKRAIGASSGDAKVAPSGSSSSSGAPSAAAAAGVVDEYEQDVPPLDMALLRGQAVAPGNAGLLLQAGEQRRELMDRLYRCLLGHLYHLARGELLRLGSALRLPEAAAAAAGSASILQLGKAAFAPAAGTASRGSSEAAARSSTVTAGSSGSRATDKKRADSKERDWDRPSSRSAAAAAGSSSSSRLSAGVDLLREAAASGGFGPRMVAQLQELLLTPLCGFSQMINKYADGSGGALTYEMHTPKLGLDEDPLAAALCRADSQSTPFCNSFTSIPNSSSSRAQQPTAQLLLLLALLLVSLTACAGPAAAATAAAAAQLRLLAVAAPPQQQGSSSSRAAAEGSAEAGAAAGEGLSAASVADSASSAAGQGDAQGGALLNSAQTAPADVAPSAASLSAASVSGLKDTSALALGPAPLRVATHVRSASALPASGGAGTAGAAGSGLGARLGGFSAPGAVSPRRLEGLVDPGAIAALQAPSGSGSSGGSSRVPAQQSALQPAGCGCVGGGGRAAWVGEWRLQLALRSPACFEACAWCYAKSGRLRSSALIYADVAGWQLLLGQLLPKLLAVQRLAAQPLLPFTALSLLALPPDAAAAADRQAAFEELLSAVGRFLRARWAWPYVLQLASLSAVQLRPAPAATATFAAVKHGRQRQMTRQQQQKQQQAAAGAGARAVAASQAASSKQQHAAGAAAVRWQEGEELLTSRLSAAYTPGAAGDPSSSSSSSSAFPGPGGAAGDPSSSSSSSSIGIPAGGSSGGCQLLPDGCLLLVPGLNRLVFQLAPVREGLYCLKQLRALLGTSGELLIGMPPASSLSLLAAACAAFLQAVPPGWVYC